MDFKIYLLLSSITNVNKLFNSYSCIHQNGSLSWPILWSYFVRQWKLVRLWSMWAWLPCKWVLPLCTLSWWIKHLFLALFGIYGNVAANVALLFHRSTCEGSQVSECTKPHKRSNLLIIIFLDSHASNWYLPPALLLR